MNVEEIVETKWRARCGATWDPMPYGCSGGGPKAVSRTEAIELAIREGWVRKNGHFICPGHQYAFVPS